MHSFKFSFFSSAQHGTKCYISITSQLRSTHSVFFHYCRFLDNLWRAEEAAEHRQGVPAQRYHQGGVRPGVLPSPPEVGESSAALHELVQTLSHTQHRFNVTSSCRLSNCWTKWVHLGLVQKACVGDIYQPLMCLWTLRPLQVESK